MRDTISIDITHDGHFGYIYFVSDLGVLIAKGWIRCDTHAKAIQLVRDLINSLQKS